MERNLKIKYNKPEQKEGAELLERFCNEWGESYKKAQEQRARRFKEYLRQRQALEQDAQPAEP